MTNDAKELCKEMNELCQGKPSREVTDAMCALLASHAANYAMTNGIPQDEQADFILSVAASVAQKLIDYTIVSLAVSQPELDSIERDLDEMETRVKTAFIN
jgi:hypothetical protein